MLTLEINKYQPPKQPEKNRYVVGSDEHKEYIFQRNALALAQNDSFYIGCKVRSKWHSGIGQVMGVCGSVKECEWDGLKVRLVEVFFPKEKEEHMFALFHPSEIDFV